MSRKRKTQKRQMQRVPVKSRRVAKFGISEDLLNKMLALPRGTEIISIWKRHPTDDVFMIAVSNPSFPAVMEGEQLPLITPTVSGTRGKIEFNFNYPEKGEK